MAANADEGKSPLRMDVRLSERVASQLTEGTQMSPNVSQATPLRQPIPVQIIQANNPFTKLKGPASEAAGPEVPTMKHQILGPAPTMKKIKITR